MVALDFMIHQISVDSSRDRQLNVTSRAKQSCPQAAERDLCNRSTSLRLTDLMSLNKKSQRHKPAARNGRCTAGHEKKRRVVARWIRRGCCDLTSRLKNTTRVTWNSFPARPLN